MGSNPKFGLGQVRNIFSKFLMHLPNVRLQNANACLMNSSTQARGLNEEKMCPYRILQKMHE